MHLELNLRIFKHILGIKKGTKNLNRICDRRLLRIPLPENQNEL